ncbi:MAG: TIGR03000 domain-containing protein [Thermoguttaceae bacterium]
MIRQSWKKVLFGTVVAMMLLTAVESANAWWWGCGRGGCWGCGSCYGGCGGCGWYGGCGRWGCGYGCGYGCYGGCYSSCYSGCYSGCYGTYGCCGGVAATCCGSTITTAAPAMPTPAKKPLMEGPTPAAPSMPPEPGAQPTTTEPAPPMPGTNPAPATEPATMSSPTPETSGVVTVWVPYDAKVTINGLATRSVGSRRQFVSYGLKPGFSYKYEIHAEAVSNGKLVEDNRTVTLTAGETVSVAFGVIGGNPAAAVASAN